MNNLTDDGEEFEYEYDGYSRLRFIYERSSSQVLAEFQYNAMGHRTRERRDTNSDGDLDDELWTHFIRDENGTIVEIFHDGNILESNVFGPAPGERVSSGLMHTFQRRKYGSGHKAGGNGGGGGGPRDPFDPTNPGGFGGSAGSEFVMVAPRRPDILTYPPIFVGKDTTANGVIDTEHYIYIADVKDLVGVSDATGLMLETVRYTTAGRPFGLPAGDVNSDGVRDVTDENIVKGWVNSTYDPRADFDRDGDVDSTDFATIANWPGMTLGLGELSGNCNRYGAGGNEYDSEIGELYYYNTVFFSSKTGAQLKGSSLSPLKRGGSDSEFSNYATEL